MTTTTNPLLNAQHRSHGAFSFDQLKKEHFMPALDQSIAEAKANLEKIKANPAEPTFENTILAYECSSEACEHTSKIFFNLVGTNSDAEMQAMAREISPKLAALASDALLDATLFNKVKAV